jgi:hypothetical protein
MTKSEERELEEVEESTRNNFTDTGVFDPESIARELNRPATPGRRSPRRRGCASRS